MTISLLILGLLAEMGDSVWREQNNVIELGYETDRQLAAAECRQLAFLYLSENPDYVPSLNGDTFSSIAIDLAIKDKIPDYLTCCLIVSVIHAGDDVSPYANRVIKTIGWDNQATSTLISTVSITQDGVVPKSFYYQ